MPVAAPKTAARALKGKALLPVGLILRELSHSAIAATALLQISGGGAQRHLIGLPSLLPGFGRNKLDRLGQSRGADAEGALDDARFPSDVMRDVKG
jgi:hypothetical protein